MEAPDAVAELGGTMLEDEDGQGRSHDEILGDDGDSYRRECDRVLDEDSDSGEPGQEVDGEDPGMDLDKTDQEVITESTSFGEIVGIECNNKKTENYIIREIWQGPKENAIKKPPPLPAAPVSERSSVGTKGTEHECGFPQQYFTVKANRARSENQVMLGGAGGFSRVGGGGACRTAVSILSRILGNSR
jgi:hypothetical protein